MSEQMPSEDSGNSGSNKGDVAKDQGVVEAKGDTSLDIGPGFLSKAERPYAGGVAGRIEDSKRDPEDVALQARGASIEDSRIAEGKAWAAQHGNVGFSGSYEVNPLVER